MRQAKAFVGRIAFYVFWPFFYVLLKMSLRSRVVLLCGDDILLVQGWLNGDGTWSLPGGGVHRGEQPVIGAIREVKEEVGVSLKPGDLEDIGTGVQHWRGFALHYRAFGVRLAHKPNIVLSSLELQKAEWFALDDITNVPTQPATYFALQHWSATKNRVNL